jgi:hypothetical protein
MELPRIGQKQEQGLNLTVHSFPSCTMISQQPFTTITSSEGPHIRDYKLVTTTYYDRNWTRLHGVTY